MMPVDAEQELVNAATEYSAVMKAVESSGRVKRASSHNGKSISALRAELAELDIDSKALLRNPVEGDHDSGAKAIRIPAGSRSPIPERSRSVIPV